VKLYGIAVKEVFIWAALTVDSPVRNAAGQQAEKKAARVRFSLTSSGPPLESGKIMSTSLFAGKMRASPEEGVVSPIKIQPFSFFFVSLLGVWLW
jgi:hypothetical protein